MIEMYEMKEKMFGKKKTMKKKKDYVKEYSKDIGYAQSSKNKKSIVRNNPFR